MKENMPWQTGEFRDGEVHLVNVEYICNHIYPKQKKRVDAKSDYNPATKSFDYEIGWTISKEHTIDELLDSGVKPEDVYPIKLYFLPDGTYCAEDGITRLRVFRKRGIESIYARMHHGD